MGGRVRGDGVHRDEAQAGCGSVREAGVGALANNSELKGVKISKGKHLPLPPEP